MTTRLLLGLCIAAASAGSLTATAQQPAAPDLSIKISTPIYRANGNIDGGSGTWKLQMNQPIVAYPNGGAGFCGPADAAGWRVEVTPVSQGKATVLNVNWQHVSLATADAGQQLLSERQALTALEGRASGSARDLNDLLLARRRILDIEGQLGVGLKGSPVSTRELTLQPGDRVVLDYISTNLRTISPNMAVEVAHVTGRPPCDAVGMGLEISLESTQKAPTIVESELWLIHTRPDKTEDTQHQTLRVRAGDNAMYWFDPVLVQVSAVVGILQFPGETRVGEKPDRSKPVAAIRVSGRLAPVDLGDGKIHMKLTIARSGQDKQHHTIGGTSVGDIALEPPAGGSATYDLTAEPGEVLSFQLPAITGNGGYAPAGTLSVRFRARILTTIPTTTTTTTPITLNQR